MQKKCRVLALGWYGATNLGDELLLQTLLHWCKELGGELTVVSLNPKHTSQAYGVSVVDFCNLGEIARALACSDLFVLGGGGIFQDHFPFTIDALYDPTVINIAQYARPFYMARQFGITTLILAHGVGPLTSVESRQIARDVFSLADFVSLRDDESAKLLRNIGVERDVLVAADPGWLGAAMLQEALGESTGLPRIPEKKRLALIIREWEKDSGWEQKLITAINNSLPSDWCVVWFAFQHAVDESRVISDRPFLEKLSADFDQSIESSFFESSDISSVVTAINQCDAVVSMRLHGSIISLALSKPTVHLEYDEKMVLANDMAGVPYHARIKLPDSEMNYEAALTELFEPAHPAWQMGSQKKQAFQSSALLHKSVLSLAFEKASQSIGQDWSGRDFDWVGAWLQSLSWQKRLVERSNEYAHELLKYRDSQLYEKDRQLEKFKSELKSYIAEKDAYIVESEAGMRLLKLELDAKNSEIQTLVAESQRQKAYIGEKEIHVATLMQEIERKKVSLEVFMPTIISKIKPKVQRVMYLLRNGGVPALLSAIKRHKQMRAAVHHVVSIGALAPSAIASADSSFGAAQLRDEELIIFGQQAFSWMAEHHRAAQLARAALAAGHKVIYVCAEVGQYEVAGMRQCCLSQISPADLFKWVSEKAVIWSALFDAAVLPFIQYSGSRGLITYLDCPCPDMLDRLSSDPLFGQFLQFSRAICVTSLALNRLENFDVPIIEMPAAVSHVYYDSYRQYQRPDVLPKSGGHMISLVFSPAAGALIDWKYFLNLAKLNGGVAFYLLGVIDFPIDLPKNIIPLAEVNISLANALIAHCDFLLAPFIEGAFTRGSALQGVFAAEFLNKPIVSSQKLDIEYLSDVHYLSEPISLIDLDLKRKKFTSNDMFVASNSWLDRLERLIPPNPRHDVSVVILIHNNAAIIERCLSTLLQHCRAYCKEVIVVDNASVDDGAQIVAKKFPTVRLVHNPKNGCSSGRNLGVAHATGKYIAFFDSDQWFTGSSGFGEALSILEKHADVGAIGWNAGWFDASRTDLGGMIADYCPNRAMNGLAIRQGYRSDIGFLGTSGFFTRRTTFDAIEGFDTFYDPTCFEDTDLCFQIKALGMSIAFRDLSGVRHQPHQTTGADTGSEKYSALFLRNAAYFKEKWKAFPQFFVDYVL